MSKNWHICSTKSDGSIWKKKIFFDQEKEEEKAADGKIAGIWRASYSW